MPAGKPSAKRCVSITVHEAAALVAARAGVPDTWLDDVRYLLRYLNLTSPDEALGIVARCFEEDQLLPKIRLVLEELISG